MYTIPALNYAHWNSNLFTAAYHQEYEKDVFISRVPNEFKHHQASFRVS
jgi:hypothetical protein